MLYHLFQLLQDYDFPGQHLMGYLSFLAMLAITILASALAYDHIDAETLPTCP